MSKILAKSDEPRLSYWWWYDSTNLRLNGDWVVENRGQISDCYRI